MFRACSELLFCRYEKKFLREFSFADRRFFCILLGLIFAIVKNWFFFSLLGIKFCHFQEVSLVEITTLHFFYYPTCNHQVKQHAEIKSASLYGAVASIWGKPRQLPQLFFRFRSFFVSVANVFWREKGKRTANKILMRDLTLTMGIASFTIVFLATALVFRGVL